MDSHRKNSLVKYLSENRYVFDLKDFESSQNRLKLFVSFEGKECVAVVIQQEDPVHEKDMLTEISIYQQLEKNDEKIAPTLMGFSREDYWLIREKIDGEITGNVYCFDQSLLTDHFSEELVTGLKKFIQLDLQVPIDLTLKYLINRLEMGTKRSLQYLDLVESLIVRVKNSDLGKKIQNPSVFLHGDLQPTNILTKNQKVVFIDFETVRLGHPQYDFASLYHRAEFNKEWQKSFAKQYKMMLD